MKEIFGTGVALVTPFNTDFSIDFNSLEKLINYVIDGGVDYLVILGTTGESVTLSKEEKSQIINFCKKINNDRLPIILGIGGSSTRQVIYDIKNTNLDGIHAILSVSPAYNKPTQEGIYQHYKYIADSTDLPIVLYNVPGRTSSNIEAKTTLKLAHNVNNIVAIKEASGNLDQILQIIKQKPQDFSVISGDDALTLPMINMGASGVISVIGQSFPKEFSQMVDLALNKEQDKANKIHLDLYDFYYPLYYEGNPVGIKACLELQGICKSIVRLPLVKASDNIFNHLKNMPYFQSIDHY